jgi:hypothetical protein
MLRGAGGSPIANPTNPTAISRAARRADQRVIERACRDITLPSLVPVWRDEVEFLPQDRTKTRACRCQGSRARVTDGTCALRMSLLVKRVKDAGKTARRFVSKPLICSNLYGSTGSKFCLY